MCVQTMPCSQHNIHIVNQHCISFYVLYNARNMFKPILGWDCYPLLVLRLPNDFLFHSEPKVARWDPLHQYWTTNSVLGVDINMAGWGWGWVERQHGWGGAGCGSDVNMGWWGGAWLDVNMGGWGGRRRQHGWMGVDVNIDG